MDKQCSEKRFLQNVENHTMKTLKEDGVYRHISFTNNGSSVYRFDLITWPGSLCIDGDCGTYTFSRITDMFEFFRTDEHYRKTNPERTLFINPGYWGGKMRSVGRNAGYKEFSEEMFRRYVLEHVDLYFEDEDAEEGKTKVLQQVEDEVFFYLDDDGPDRVYAQVNAFECGDFQFVDFFDGLDTEEYTFHYLWCLYAIAYGVMEYDKQKETT